MKVVFVIRQGVSTIHCENTIGNIFNKLPSGKGEEVLLLGLYGFVKFKNPIILNCTGTRSHLCFFRLNNLEYSYMGKSEWIGSTRLTPIINV